MSNSSSPIRPVHSICSAATNNKAYSYQVASPLASSTSPRGNSTPESQLERREIASNPAEFYSLSESDHATRIATLRRAALDSMSSRYRPSVEEADPSLAPPVKRRREGHIDRSDSRSIAKTVLFSLKSYSQSSDLSHSRRVADFSDYQDRNTASSSRSSGQGAEPSYLPDSNRLPDSSRISGYSRNAQINQSICEAARRGSIRDIESICCRKERDLDGVNITTALHRIAQITKITGERPSRDTLDRLIDCSLYLMEKLKPQNLSSMTWALATLKIHDGRLMRALALAAVDQIQAFKPQELSNTAWAFATLGFRNDRLMNALAFAAERQIQAFTPQAISNTAWAFATLGICDNRLMRALALAAVDQIQAFTPQAISNTAWAFATLGICDNRLMQALALEAVGQIQKFKPQELSNTAWAFATLGICDNRLMGALGLAAESQIQQFKPQELSNIAWAFAMLENEGSDLFRSIARELESQSHNKFNAMGIQQLRQAQSALKLYGLDFSLIPAHWNLEAPIPHCQISGFQREVGSYLQSLAELKDEELKTEFFIHEIDHCIDFTVGKIAFEVDGPTHFAFESSTPLGPVLFRNRLLRQLGWKLVCIPYWEWNPLKTEEEKRSYLNRKIEEVLKCDLFSTAQPSSSN